MIIRCVSIYISIDLRPNSSFNTINILLFDLDGTLYDVNCGYVEHQRQNNFRFLYDKGFVPRDKSAEAVWKPLFKKYNQTKCGLKAAGFKFDDEEYWESIRSGMETYLKPDLVLRNVLLSLSQPKYVFTNCNETQAQFALERLGIADCFDGIFGATLWVTIVSPTYSCFRKY